MNTTFADLSAALLHGQQSDVGKRPNQEDRWEIREFQTADGRPATLAMVADGIGGHSSGEMASEMAKNLISGRLVANPPAASEITRRLKTALEEAGQAIYDASLEDPNRSGMGTTCTAIVIADRRLYLAHVGDSRAWLLRGGQLRQLSFDHTWAEEAIRAGRPAEEIRTHPNRGVIMRYLGIDPTVSIDTRYRGPAGEPVDGLQAGPLFLEPGDTLMLSTDGVSDSLSVGQVAEFMAFPDCQAAADALVSSAIRAGATDNVTAVVLRLPGGAVVPFAAQRQGGRKLPVLPLLLAALALVIVGAVAALALTGGNRAAPTAPPTVIAVEAPTASLPAPTSTRTETSGGGVATAPAPEPPEAPPPSVAAAPPLQVVEPTITASAEISATVPISDTQSLPGEPTVIPTHTATPTRTPYVPPTPRPTGTQPPPAATARLGVGGVTLISPPKGEAIKGPWTFEWEDTGGFELRPGELYELIFWKPGENGFRDGKSPIAATRVTKVEVNLADADLAGNEFGLYFDPGQWNWGIALRDATRDRRVRLLSDGTLFTFDRPPSGGGGGSTPATSVPDQ